VQRGPLHAAYARALERRIGQGGAGSGSRSAAAVERGQLAFHWYAAHDLGQALVASVQAGQAAESASALAEAVGHYERALQLWDQVPEAAARSPLDRGMVLYRAAEAANLAGYDDRAVALGRLALDRVDAVAEPRRAGALLERLARAVAAHGQLLMLLGHHAEALARCQEAVAVARQVDARAVEGHALCTLGTSLGVLGHLEEGIADLEQGRRIARELTNVDDLGRVHASLATVLEMAGRSADAVEVFLTGADVARQVGALGRYGPNLLGDAANSLLSLGRREDAERLLDQVFDLDLGSPALRLRPLTVRGTLRVRTGDLAGAQADLGRILDEVPAPLDPQNATPVFGGLAEVALWDGRLADAEEQAARELAAGLVERARAAVAAPNVVPTPAVEANRGTAKAEWSRVTGPGDPERWADSAHAWEALGYPWQAGYARWRQAEALLAQGASRPDAAAALARARTLAGGLGARPLTAEIDTLSRRARIELPVPAGEGAPDAPAQEPATVTDELGLTPREREVLALVADGRTNRQVGEALFISAKTASVHVSNILAKLGVANRGEAAAVAHRLRLTG
jgi:DNA-binding CsgD family transcriptional regulator/tetratricopeptide (TPR) repeat protein